VGGWLAGRPQQLRLDAGAFLLTPITTPHHFPPCSSFLHNFVFLFAWFLAVLFGALLTSFFFFHVHLLSRNMTTIEWCASAGHRRAEAAARAVALRGGKPQRQPLASLTAEQLDALDAQVGPWAGARGVAVPVAEVVVSARRRWCCRVARRLCTVLSHPPTITTTTHTHTHPTPPTSHSNCPGHAGSP
jgi:hypothetical protein